jgi:hypothetical protein
MAIIFSYGIVGFFLMSFSSSAFTAVVPSSTSHDQSLKFNRRTPLCWSDGKNAAPAVLCEVENIPILEPIPEG